MQALDGARIGTGAQGVGVAEGALELSVKYTKERVQFGKPIGALQGIQWYIADMATKTEAVQGTCILCSISKKMRINLTQQRRLCVKLNCCRKCTFCNEFGTPNSW